MDTVKTFKRTVALKVFSRNFCQNLLSKKIEFFMALINAIAVFGSQIDILKKIKYY